MGDWTYIESYTWRDEHGDEVLKHKKYRLPDGSKAMPWYSRHPQHGGWVKGIRQSPPPHQKLLFNLPELLAAGRRAHVFITEGESDCDALTVYGAVAVSYGHAGNFTAEHALWFKGWRGRITIVRDRDLPGKLSALQCYDALRDVGLTWRQVRIVRGRAKGKGADARDHLDAGWGLDAFIAEPVAKLRLSTANVTPLTIRQAFKRAGYRPQGGVNPKTGYAWGDEWDVQS